MRPEEYPKFCDAWLNSHAMSSSNQEPKESTLLAVFDVLISYSLANVLGALKVHAKKSRFAPTPSDICEIIDSYRGNKHIGSDEAWSIVVCSFDENETVVITKEIMQARGLILDVYTDGDKVGARMAFKDAYNRIISTAKEPIWFVCQGFDSKLRYDAVKKAVDLKRLPYESENKYLLDPPKTTIAGLIEMSVKRDENDGKKAIAKLKAIKALLIEETDPIYERDAERKAFESKRQTELAKLEKAGGNKLTMVSSEAS